MKNGNIQTIIEYCDHLTRNDEKLSVTWNGGGDVGLLNLLLNDEDLPEPSEFEKPIIDMVANYLGYGSFAGDYNTEGELIYNNENKCFEGTDTYSTSDIDEKYFPIEIRIPKKIWFDQLEIYFEFNEEFQENTSIRLVIENGPRSDVHSELENQLSEHVSKKVTEATQNIGDLNNVWVIATINYNDFKIDNDDLVFTIQKIEYSFTNYENNDISIDLTEKLTKDVTT